MCTTLALVHEGDGDREGAGDLACSARGCRTYSCGTAPAFIRACCAMAPASPFNPVASGRRGTPISLFSWERVYHTRRGMSRKTVPQFLTSPGAHGLYLRHVVGVQVVEIAGLDGGIVAQHLFLSGGLSRGPGYVDDARVVDVGRGSAKAPLLSRSSAISW